MSDHPDLSIIIVSYNTRDLTLACLRSIESFPPSCRYETIVVDNASRDDSVESIRKNHPHVKLICSETNLGFARANNQALLEAQGEILVLLNSDTEVHPGALDDLWAAFRNHPEIAAGGGRLLNSDGTLQYGVRYHPRLSNAISEALFLHRLFNGPCWSEIETDPKKYESFHRAEWLSGAYLAIRRDWFQRVGGLDPGFFMYSEDSDWCRRIEDAGGLVAYIPDSVVTHHGGGSSRTANEFLLVMRTRARDRYARIHMNPMAAAAYRLILAFGLLLRAALFLLICPFGSQYRKNLWWRLKALCQLYASPLPLKTNE